MNILFFYVTTINPISGGIQRVTDILGRYFIGEGFNVSYLSARKKGEDMIFNQYYLPNSCQVNVEENRLYYLNFLKENNIDIVINQSAINPKICSHIIRWTTECGIKIISVFHNSLSGMYGVRGGHLLPLTRVLSGYPIIIKYIDIVFHFLFKRKYHKEYAQIVSQSDSVILLSNKFKDEIVYFSGINKQNHIETINNPITISILDYKSTKAQEVLFVGRLSDQKRIDLLLRIWQKVYKDFPEWTLKIVGDGENRKQVEEDIEKLQLKNIKLFGAQAPEPYYSAASIFCLTSAYEGFGLVLTEAMFYGVVPIAFASYPNVTDIIDDGINGFLISPFDTDKYASKLRELMTNSTLIENMSSKAKEKSNEFCIRDIGRKWINLFQSLK